MLQELNFLNPAQREAAETFNGSLLILAGAGSGKTKTLVTRVANMIHNGIDGRQILVMTFTNKAAKEMQERGMKMLEDSGSSSSVPTFTTFHGWCFRFVKNYVEYSGEGLTQDCQVADEATVKNITKTIISSPSFQAHIKSKIGYWDKSLEKIKTEGAFTLLQNKLCPYKDADKTYDKIIKIIDKYGKRGKDISPLGNAEPLSEAELMVVAEIFVEYKKTLRRNNLIDFDDLINLSIKIMKNNKEIREMIHNKYNYYMVDEFQDTNSAQMKLLDLIVNKNDNLCVVGDDDQSIYGWRGAEIDYILGFSDKRENAKVINLDINYRSTGNILKLANGLIGKNIERHSQKEVLVPNRQDRGRDKCISLFSEATEAIYVASEIKRNLIDGVKPEEIAILYRTNRIAKTLETELIKQGIPYHIFKGRTLLQKKSVAQYMSLIGYLQNRQDSVSASVYLSACSIISEAKLKSLNEMSYSKNIDFISLLRGLCNGEIENNKILSTANINKLNDFFITLEAFDHAIKDENFDMKALRTFVKNRFLLFKKYSETIANTKSEDTKEKAEASLESLNTIHDLLSKYDSLEEFLEEMVLAADKEDEAESKVNLMTIHSSKGLEFEYVYLVRFNNDVFPSYRAQGSAKELEEERRLAYVAMTRAKTSLTASYVAKGMGKSLTPSLFLKESKLIKKSEKVFIRQPSYK